MNTYKILKLIIEFRIPYGSYLPAANNVPLVVPITEITTPSGIKKLAEPSTASPQSLKDKSIKNIFYNTKSI
jgi:hypothetical protein